MMMMKMKRKIFYIRRIASFWIHNRKNGKKMKKIVYSKWKIFKNSNSDSKKKEKQKKKKIKMEKWTKNGKLFSSWHVQNKIFGKCECQYQVMVWLRWFPRLAPLICCPLCCSVNRECGPDGGLMMILIYLFVRNWGKYRSLFSHQHQPISRQYNIQHFIVKSFKFFICRNACWYVYEHAVSIACSEMIPQLPSPATSISRNSRTYM